MCEEKKDYGKTLNLPKTDFPMRASLPENEPKILEKVLENKRISNVEVVIYEGLTVDIAKETADIILLEKDLNVLEQGVINGRKIYRQIPFDN